MRNFILTAVLFLTAGIVSAETFDINDINRGTYTDYDWKITNFQEGNYALSATVIRHDGTDGWSYTAFTNTNKEWKLAVDLYTVTDEDNNSIVKAKAADGAAKLVNYHFEHDANGNITKGIYYFALKYETYNEDGVPFDTTIAVKDGSYSSLANSTSIFYKVTPTEKKYLSYNKAFTGADHEADFSFGQPLPAPLATLLIALGFGAAFVMYRNRKQVKA